MRPHYQQLNNTKMKKYLIALLGILLISFVSCCTPNPLGDCDNDGILNKDDNCWFVYNPLQIDSDEDGKGDACDSNPFGYCGDSLCIGDENETTCPLDCGSPQSFCGDGTCDAGEGCSTCPADCGICISPKNYERTSRTSHRPKQFCDPSWKCSTWSSCENGRMTRECYDANYCSYSYNQPNEIASCEINENSFVGTGTNYLPIFVFLGLIGVVALGILISLLARR